MAHSGRGREGRWFVLNTKWTAVLARDWDIGGNALSGLGEVGGTVAWAYSLGYPRSGNEGAARQKAISYYQFLCTMRLAHQQMIKHFP